MAKQKYDENKHPKEFLEYSKEGLSVSQICSKWGINRNTVYNWQKTRPEFVEAFETGFEHREAHYIRLGTQIMKGEIQGANATVFIWMTKSILKWREKQEGEVDSNVNVNTEIKLDQKTLNELVRTARGGKNDE